MYPLTPAFCNFCLFSCKNRKRRNKNCILYSPRENVIRKKTFEEFELKPKIASSGEEELYRLIYEPICLSFRSKD